MSLCLLKCITPGMVCAEFPSLWGPGWWEPCIATCWEQLFIHFSQVLKNCPGGKEWGVYVHIIVACDLHVMEAPIFAFLQFTIFFTFSNTFFKVSILNNGLYCNVFICIHHCSLLILDPHTLFFSYEHPSSISQCSHIHGSRSGLESVFNGIVLAVMLHPSLRLRFTDEKSFRTMR